MAVFVIRRYRKRNIKTMNFDNPVYRKTTSDEAVSLDKQNYQPPFQIEPRLQSPVRCYSLMDLYLFCCILTEVAFNVGTYLARYSNEIVEQVGADCLFRLRL
jgi:hypothetical protein